jgi:hypothetical protein
LGKELFMLFEHAGKIFDTVLMIAYETHDPLTPTIYQSTCGRHVLIGEFDIKQKTKLRYASEPDVFFCARKFAIPALLETYARGECNPSHPRQN